MKILELFSGTESFSKVARELGHETFTIDNNPIFKPDLCIDIEDLNIKEIPFKPDVIWASPPCTCFSVASFGKHWLKNYVPKTEQAEKSIRLVGCVIDLIREFNPKYWFIENPRGMLRKLDIIPQEYLKTAWYCKYGDKRAKPTDIWTNLNIKLKTCKNGNKDHEQSPRGSKTGTQGLKNSIERSKVPRKLCLELLSNINH